jgi:hypothetical protein
MMKSPDEQWLIDARGCDGGKARCDGQSKWTARVALKVRFLDSPAPAAYEAPFPSGPDLIGRPGPAKV